MILYLDTSAYIKRYIRERGSAEIKVLIELATSVGSSRICRAEMEAALAKIVRMNPQIYDLAWHQLQAFRSDWPLLFKIELTEEVVALAGDLAWEHGLRGYDAVHLASAVIWQRLLQEPITFATFDRRLWTAAQVAGMMPFPHSIDLIVYAPEG